MFKHNSFIVSLKNLKITCKLAFFVIFLFGFVVYGNSLFNEFVFDDQFLILNNNKYHSLNNIPGFFFGYDPAKSDNSALYYRPVAYAIETINYSLYHQTPFFYHLFRVFIHILSSFFLFYLFEKFFNLKISLLGALLFLVHPINIEAVSWTLDGGLFFFVFGIAALVLLMANSARKWIMPAVVLLLFCSILTKETGFIFLFIALFYVWFYKPKLTRKFLAYSGIMVASDLILRNIRLIPFTYANQNSVSPIMLTSSMEKLLTAPSIIMYYLKTFFYPFNLAVSQHWIIRSAQDERFRTDLISVMLITVALLLIAIFVFKYYKKEFKVYVFFLLWFTAGLIPELHIIPLTMTVADRWFYLSAAGAIGQLLVLLKLITKINYRIQYLIIPVFLIIVCLFSYRTILRNIDWKNGYTLYSHDLQLSKESHQLENNLASELVKQNRLDEALVHLKRANKLFPSPLNYYNLGVVSQSKKDFKNAKYYYQKTIDLNKEPKAYEQLSYIMLITEGEKPTVKYAEKLLTEHPDNPGIWLVLALANYKLGNYDDALEDAKKAYLLEHSQRAINIYQAIQQKKKINYSQ